MNLDLSTERFVASTVARPSVGRPDLHLVAPGRPEDSYLLMKVRGDEGIIGSRMPFGQDPLPSEEIEAIRDWIAGLDAGDASLQTQPPRDRYSFLGWRVVNLPTNRSVQPRTMVVLIGHRFNPSVATGLETFFGLDGSSVILLAATTAITEKLRVQIGRSNHENDFELGVTYDLVDSTWLGSPANASVRGTLNWRASEPASGSRLRADAFSWSGQVVFTSALGDRGGMAVVPGVLVNPGAGDESPIILVTIGLGGRWALGRTVSVLAEWVPILSGYRPSTMMGNLNRYDAISGGLEIATAGHVFQIVASNSLGLATDQYLRGGDLNVGRAHVRLGFNIFRVINF